MMYNRRQSMCVTLILSAFLYCFHEAEAQDYAEAFFNTGGVSSRVRLRQNGSSVHFDPYYPIPPVRWQIHELPVDYSIDPKWRCMPEHVGKCLLHSGRDRDYIYNMTITSLFTHSIVLLVNDTPVTCGTIIPHYGLPEIPVTHVTFKSGVFGKIYNFYWPRTIDTGRSYVFGEIQTEWKLQVSSEDMTSNISIAIHNDTLGPYDTVKGCERLKGVKTLLSISVNCSSCTTFSQKLPESQRLSSHIGYAVSIQNSSGKILGCGRIETLFPVNARDSTNEKIIFSQYAPYIPPTLVGDLNSDIPQYNVLEGIAGTVCSESAVFDPWSPQSRQIGNRTTPDQFPVGELSYLLDRRAVLPNLYQYVVLEISLIGNATILGHVVNDSDCSSLELSVPGTDCSSSMHGNGYIVKGYAEFHGPILTGKMNLTQAVYLPEEVLGPTIITVNVSLPMAFEDITQNTSGHVWNIHEGFTDRNGTCPDHIGDQYNPYGVNTTKESGYMTDCSSLSQQRCAMGDFSGKLGLLTTSPHKTYSFYDENLFLTGPFTIFGHSIVVKGTGKQSGQLLGCATIEPSIKKEIEISFPRNDTEHNDSFRIELGHSISRAAEVPLGDVLVNNVEAVNISGSDCLTASLWITGVNDGNASLNLERVMALNKKNHSKYSEGLCVPPNGTMPTNIFQDQNITIISVSQIVAAVITALTVSVLIVGGVLILAFKRKRRVVIYTVEGQEGTREFSPALLKLLSSKGDKWEIRVSHFKIGNKLGEGNYGQVYKGILSIDVATAPAKRFITRQTKGGKSPYTVAIKLLKGGAEEREVANFLEEIAMMKKVSSGECCHVVQMVGCVSTALPLALVMDFVPFGDLLSYLKYWRKKCNAQAFSQPSVLPSPGCDELYRKEGKEEGQESQDPAADVGQEDILGGEEALYFAAALDQEEKVYIGGDERCSDGNEESLAQLSVPPSSGCDKLYARKREQEVLYSATMIDLESFYSPLGEPDLRDLPSFAYQIAQGMDYLSSLGVLHRDLACRNILVDERKLLKISDFGLSRDTPEYVSSLKDKMPLRWMAPETVTENVFTDKSDVWSFGVCLWEMFTLGGMPYEDVPMATLMARIISGYRLHMPEHASEKVYQLMLGCWDSEPQARLNFTQLKYSFKSIIAAGENDTNYITIQP